MKKSQKTFDSKRYELIETFFVPEENYISYTTELFFKYYWFQLYLFLCYYPVEDGAYCLSYLLFAGSKRTLAKSLAFRH